MGAPIDRVWRLGTDIARWPEWLVGLREVTDLSGPGDQVATTAVLVLKGPGLVRHLRLEVTEVERPTLHSHVAREVGGGMSYTSTIRLTPAGDGTDFVWEQEIEAGRGLMGAIADRIFVKGFSERNMRQSCDNFEALVRQAEVLEPV